MTAYRIRLKERLDQGWSAWLGGLTVIHEATGETVLIGELADQAALHGLISNRARPPADAHLCQPSRGGFTIQRGRKGGEPMT